MTATKRTPLFWIVLLLGGAFAFCCLASMGVLMLGAVADDPAPASSTGASGEYLPAGEIARGQGLTQQLTGGRWLFQNGSNLETVSARTTDTVFVQTSSVGSLHELTFEDDGSYRWAWVHSMNFQGKSRSSAVELGDWALEGSTLTLTPASQQATYTNRSGAQEKEDQDLSPRVYQVVDITLQTVEHTGAPMKQVPGIELSGPPGPWDLAKDNISVDLQRL